MTSNAFHQWLASLLGQNEYAAQTLLEDQTALHFLIAWSLFEAKIAGGRFEAKRLLDTNFYPSFSQPETGILKTSAYSFHKRYQDQQCLNALAPEQSRVKAVFNRVTSCLHKEKPPDNEASFLCAFVASRVRNNMFHGIKGIEDWLRDKVLIESATQVLTTFVSAKERQLPSLKHQPA